MRLVDHTALLGRHRCLPLFLLLSELIFGPLVALGDHCAGIRQQGTLHV
jgi:hypothetical protein